MKHKAIVLVLLFASVLMAGEDYVPLPKTGTVSIIDERTHFDESICVLWQDILGFQIISRSISSNPTSHNLTAILQELSDSFQNTAQALGACEQTSSAAFWHWFFPEDTTKTKRRFLRAKEAYWQCMTRGDANQCSAQQEEFLVARTYWMKTHDTQKAPANDLSDTLCHTATSVREWVTAYESKEVEAETALTEIGLLVTPIEQELAAETVYSGNVRLDLNYNDFVTQYQAQNPTKIFKKLPIYHVAVAWGNQTPAPWIMAEYNLVGRFELHLQDVCLGAKKMRPLRDVVCNDWSVHYGFLSNNNAEVLRERTTVQFSCDAPKAVPPVFGNFKCLARGASLKHPDGASRVLFVNEACTIAFVPPPPLSKIDIESITATLSAHECPPLPKIDALAERLSSPAENEDIVRKHRESTLPLKTFHLKGALLLNWQELIQAYRDLNGDKIQFQALPVRKPNITIANPYLGQKERIQVALQMTMLEGKNFGSFEINNPEIELPCHLLKNVSQQGLETVLSNAQWAFNLRLHFPAIERFFIL